MEMRLLITFLMLTGVTSHLLANPSKLLSAPFWDDGKAEISIYSAKRYHYGRLYDSKIEYFFVKESFSESKLIKTDDYHSKDATQVIKLNQVISTPTGTYDYQQMHSSFWSKDSGKLLKFSMSHHEACGSSYKQGVLADGSLQVKGATYWEGQSKIQESVKMDAGLWWYDELPLRTRQLVADRASAPAKLRLVPSTIHSKAGSYQHVPANLTVDDFTVTITHAGGKEVLKFDPKWPHVMTSWQQASGESLTLERTLRLDYWNHHAPGDEKLLK